MVYGIEKKVRIFVRDYKKYLRFIKERLIKSVSRDGSDGLYIDTKHKILMCYKTQFHSDKLPREWYKTDDTNPFVDDNNNALTDQCYNYIRRYLGLGRKDRFVIFDEYNHQKPLGCYKVGDRVIVCVYYKKGVL